ncbi:MAG: GNAT family N-acetyltransferase [Syntrophaceae bacterium]|jgi:putative acetyltransferase|nr:GNAT family N-acetyltransferase [Syntrophaceae bacterium]
MSAVRPIPKYRFQPMEKGDLAEVIQFWQGMEGIGLSESDSYSALSFFLRRNPRLSWVTRNEEGELVGAVLCGHDGRRGYLHHLAVARDHRRKGIGKALVERCLSSLRDLKVLKCNIFLFAHNPEGQEFWEAMGWKARKDLILVQRKLSL